MWVATIQVFLKSVIFSPDVTSLQPWEDDIPVQRLQSFLKLYSNRWYIETIKEACGRCFSLIFLWDKLQFLSNIKYILTKKLLFHHPVYLSLLSVCFTMM